ETSHLGTELARRAGSRRAVRQARVLPLLRHALPRAWFVGLIGRGSCRTDAHGCEVAIIANLHPPIWPGSEPSIRSALPSWLDVALPQRHPSINRPVITGDVLARNPDISRTRMTGATRAILFSLAMTWVGAASAVAQEQIPRRPYPAIFGGAIDEKDARQN